MSRPEKPIDWKLVDRLLMAGCMGTEIAPHFDIHHERFYDRVKEKYGMGFTEYCSLKRCHGDSILRDKQFQKALSGDNSMLIWLGKNRLKQSDKETNEIVDEFKKYLNDKLKSQSQVNECGSNPQTT